MRLLLSAAFAASLAVGPVRTWACQISCTKEVVGDITTITQYPATIQYKLTFSIEPGGGDYLIKILDSLLPSGYFDGQQVPPWYPGVPVLNHTSYDMIVTSPVFTYSIEIPSYAECARLAGGDPSTMSGPVTLTNFVTAENYFADNLPPSCRASVICQPSGSGATRTPGWWKNRVDALAACVAGGVDLGYASITSVGEALGLLWSDEGAYVGLDKARLKLARATLVAYCNSTSFGAVPDFDFSAARGLLAGSSCDAMVTLAGAIDAFNNRFDDVALPPGLDPGPSYGVTAKTTAIAPVFPSGTCTP